MSRTTGGRVWPAALFACSLFWGCAGPTADVTITVDNSGGSPAGAPGTVEVNLFDDSGRIGGAPLADPRLPSALRVTALPTSRSQLRIVAVGYVGADAREALLAATALPAPEGAASVALDLSPDFRDGDGDAVPDELDDCPTVYDPEQRRPSGIGPGDACVEQRR